MTDSPTTRPAAVTDAEIAELRRLAAAATPGPWTLEMACDDVIGNVQITHNDWEIASWVYGNPDAVFGPLPDQHLIVAMRNALPGLLTALSATQAALARAEGALRIIRDDYGQVCEAFETCQHAACQASYSAWHVADAALRGELPTPRADAGGRRGWGTVSNDATGFIRVTVRDNGNTLVLAVNEIIRYWPRRWSGCAIKTRDGELIDVSESEATISAKIHEAGGYLA